MKTFSNDFRNSLRGVRELDAVITYKSDKYSYILTTENSNYLTTENSKYLLTEKADYQVQKESIVSIERKFTTNLLKTLAKAVIINSKETIPKGTKIKVQFGVLVGNDYEYVLDGTYYTISEPTFKANTNSYEITAYSKMYEAMIKFDKLDIKFPISIKDLVIEICKLLNWNYDLSTFPNSTKILNENIYDNQDLTYREILDDISTITGGSFMFDDDEVLIWKSIKNISNEKVNDEDILSVNADLGEKYGPVNKIVATTNLNVSLGSKQDDTSIKENGETTFNIDDNRLLNYNADLFIDELFDEIDGLEYYLYDLTTKGLLIFDPLDGFIVEHDEKEYKSLILNSDLKLSSGLEESITGEKPEINQEEYTTSSSNITSTKTKNAIISLNKANAEIVLKVDSNGKISQVRLDGNADDGSAINIEADQVNLTANDILNLIAGNEINLTSKNITINSNNFNVDAQGNMNCNNATANALNINNGNINLTSVSENAKFVLTDYENNSCKYEQSARAIKWYGLNGGSIIMWNTGTNPIIGLSDSVNNHETNLNAWYIETPELRQTSLESAKKNFEKFNGALNIINDIDLYKYNLKHEKNGHKKHIGFVIGKNFKYSSEITAVDEKGEEMGADLYSMTSLCLQAIKEQQIQIEELKKEIQKLKEE